jgi:hypothetical protein
MQFWAQLLARAITAFISIADASNLRNRIYELKDEHEIMWTALDDIVRMYPDSPAGRYAQKTLTKIPNRYTHENY